MMRLNDGSKRCRRRCAVAVGEGGKAGESRHERHDKCLGQAGERCKAGTEMVVCGAGAMVGGIRDDAGVLQRRSQGGSA